MDYLEFIIKMHSIAKIGLKYSQDPYALENYEEIQKEAKAMLEKYTNETLKHDNYYVRDIYPTPNVSVRVLIVQDDKVLFVKEILEQKYSLPGGWADVFKSASDNAKAEVLQESGYIVEIERVLGVFDQRLYSKLKSSVSEYCIFFSAKIIGGAAKTSHETDEVVFVDKNNLPELSSKNTHYELTTVLDIYYNDKSTYFD